MPFTRLTEVYNHYVSYVHIHVNQLRYVVERIEFTRSLPCDVIVVALPFNYSLFYLREWGPLVRSQLVSMEFFIDIKSFRSHYGPGVDSAVSQWLRCCATNRKVAGSIPAGVIGIFH